MNLPVNRARRSPRRQGMVKIPALIVVMCGLLLSACQPANPLIGKWRTDPPANLLFDYQADGIVLLLEPEATYQVFHYKVIDRHTLWLIDGMGRIKKYNFKVSGSQMTYYDPARPGVALERFSRQE